MSTVAFSSVVASFGFLSLWPYVIGVYRATHSITSKICASLLLIILGLFQLAQYYLSWFGWLDIIPGYQINIGSSILFPIGISMIIQLYITRSPVAFRCIMLYILCVNCLALGFAFLMGSSWRLNRFENLDPMWSDAAKIKVVGGTALLFLDIAIAILLYRKLRARDVSRFGRVLIPIVTALTVDAAVFSVFVAYCDNRIYLITFANQVAIKILMGIFCSIFITISLCRFDIDAIDKPSESTRKFFLESLSPKSADSVHWIGAVRLALTQIATNARAFVMNQLGTDAPLADAQERAQKVLRNDWPRLLENYRGKWLAIWPTGRILVADSEDALDCLLDESKEEVGTYIVRKIVPWLVDLLDTPSDRRQSSGQPSYHESQSVSSEVEHVMARIWSDLVKSKPGKWVAISRQGSIAEDISYDGLQDQLDKLPHDDVIIRKVNEWNIPAELGL